MQNYLLDLREKIIAAFEAYENKKSFERTPWKHTTGGGGEMAVLRGDVFEKAAVNFSAVSGDHYPLSDSKGKFFATGVSLITHMANPHAPTIHMNLRYIETEEKKWFGGGFDLTPMGFPYEEDTVYFHTVAKKALGPCYEEYSRQAKEYFFLPHRNKERGVGGIFFEYIDDFEIWKSVGDHFLETILPIYERRTKQAFTEDERKTQLRMRGHYAEFNLIYDRGTKFGLLSKGNTEAIFCSLPPLATW